MFFLLLLFEIKSVGDVATKDYLAIRKR